MDAAADPFDAAADRLERLEKMKEARLIQPAEYEELRSSVLVALKAAAGGKEEEKPQAELGAVAAPPVSFGAMHARIVEVTRAGFAGEGTDERLRMARAVARMAEKGGLYPGDGEALQPLVETILSLDETPNDSDLDKAHTEILQAVGAINASAGAIRSSPERSPAARAIADTAQESATRAVQAMPALLAAPQAPPKRGRFWRRFVLKDVVGAFEGGAAAVEIFHAFAPLVAFTAPVAAAVGVVLVAGVSSALAQEEK